MEGGDIDPEDIHNFPSLPDGYEATGGAWETYAAPDVDFAEQSPEAAAPLSPLERFDGTEAAFDGDPPEAYLQAVNGIFDEAVGGPDGVIEQYRLFYDYDYVPLTEETPGTPRLHLLSGIQLEHTASEGRTELTVNYSAAEVRFIGADGTQTYRRYYVTRHQRPDGRLCRVLRKDREDIALYLPQASAGNLSPDERAALRLAAGRQRDHSKEEMGIVDPPVGIEEATYVFRHLLPEARPVAGPFSDIAGLIQREYWRSTLIRGDELEDMDRLCRQVVDAYRIGCMTPQQFMDNDPSTEHEWTTGPVTVSIKTGVGHAGGRQAEPPRPYLTVVRTSTADCDFLAEDFWRRGIAVPYHPEEVTMVDRIRLQYVHDRTYVDYQGAVKAADGKLIVPPVRFRFVPTQWVIRQLRNYLLAGGDGRASMV